VNLKQIFTIILLLEFMIFNKYHEEKLLNQIASLLISQTYLTKDIFLKMEFWFEIENPNYGKLKYLYFR